MGALSGLLKKLIEGKGVEDLIDHVIGKDSDKDAKSKDSDKDLKSERHTGIGSLLREHIGNVAVENFGGLLGGYIQHRLNLPKETKHRKVAHRDLRGLSTAEAAAGSAKEERDAFASLNHTIRQGFGTLGKVVAERDDNIERALRGIYVEVDKLGLKQKKSQSGPSTFGTGRSKAPKKGKPSKGWLDDVVDFVEGAAEDVALGEILEGGAALVGGSVLGEIVLPLAGLALLGYGGYELLGSEFKEGRREAQQQKDDPDLFKRQLEDAQNGILPGDEGATKQKAVLQPAELHVGELCYYAQDLTFDSKQKITFKSEEGVPPTVRRVPAGGGGGGGGHKPLHLPDTKDQQSQPTPNSAPTNAPQKPAAPTGPKPGMTPENLAAAAPKLQTMLDSGELGVSSSMANMAIPGIIGKDGKIDVDVLKKSGPQIQHLMEQGVIPKDKVQAAFPQLMEQQQPVTQSGKVVPQDVVNKAREFVNQGASSSQLQHFMASQGYPMAGSWCGEFMSSVVKSQGGVPPKGSAIATNWMKYGEAVDAKTISDLHPGDVIVYNRGLRAGETGGHVGMVESVEKGSFTELGGNQGHAVTERPGQQFDPSQMIIRRAPDLTPVPPPKQPPTQTVTAPPPPPPTQPFSADQGTGGHAEDIDPDRAQGRNSFTDHMGVGSGDGGDW